jgi:beta-galactosidase/beta-glucuronidase
MPRLAGLFVFVVANASAAYPPWHVKTDGPLLTRFAQDVTPDTAWQEYPRPNLVRKDNFKNLNGLWELDRFTRDLRSPPFDVSKALPEQILVPFPVESALGGVRNKSKSFSYWYRRVFQAPTGSSKKVRQLLHFEASDWNTTVYLNGHQLQLLDSLTHAPTNASSHIGGYDAFTFDVTEHMTTGQNTLVVGVYDDTRQSGHNPQQMAGKQSGTAFDDPAGIFYTGTSGIWQTVWLETVPLSYITSVYPVADLKRNRSRVLVDVSAKLATAATNVSVRVEVEVAGKVIAHATSSQLGPGRFVAVVIPSALLTLWTPDTPFLYNCTVSLLGADGAVVEDTVGSYFAMRTIEVGFDDEGVPRPLLNGEFVFHVGTLDQGWWPDGIYTAPTDEALRYDIEVHKQLGFNMIRKHVKVEPRRWYYHCDRLGMMVWQDMPAGSPGPDNKYASEFWHELKQMVLGRRFHSSIVQWVVYNEGWGQSSDADQTAALTAKLRGIDPTRLIDSITGINYAAYGQMVDAGVGSTIDLHHYSDPTGVPYNGFRISVLGEYGGLLYPVRSHSWALPKCHGYGEPLNSTEQLTSRFEQQQQLLLQLKRPSSTEQGIGLSGSVYTEITDVETECNGLMTYDRQLKVIPARIKAANGALN